MAATSLPSRWPGYLRLTTFKRDGIPVSCTVHGVVAGDRAYFRARTQSGTVRRLRHTDAVQVTPCGPLGSARTGRRSMPLRGGCRTGKPAWPLRKLDRKYPVRRRFASRLLPSQAVYYQLAADDAVRDQGGPPGELATLIIRVHETRGSVDGNAATPTSLAALCLPAIKSRSCPPDHARIVAVTASPPAGSPGQAG